MKYDFRFKAICQIQNHCQKHTNYISSCWALIISTLKSHFYFRHWRRKRVVSNQEGFLIDDSRSLIGQMLRANQKRAFWKPFLAGLVHGEDEATKVKEIMSKLHGDDPQERLRWAQPTQFYRLRRYRFKNWYKCFRKEVNNLLAVLANQTEASSLSANQSAWIRKFYFFQSPSSIQLKISEDGTSLLYANTEDKMNAKKGLQFDSIYDLLIMSHLYESWMRNNSVKSLNVNRSKPTVYFIEDLEDVTHITEESFHSIWHFDSSLVDSSPIRSQITPWKT